MRPAGNTSHFAMPSMWGRGWAGVYSEEATPTEMPEGALEPLIILQNNTARREHSTHQFFELGFASKIWTSLLQLAAHEAVTWNDIVRAQDYFQKDDEDQDFYN